MAIPLEDLYPPIHVDPSVWQLNAQPGRIEASASAWRRVGKASVAVGDGVVDDTRTLLGGSWSGVARDSFAQHQSKVVTSLDNVEAYANKVADTLDAIAGLLRRYQGALDAEHDGLRVPHSGDIYSPHSDGQVNAVHAAVARAQQLRTELENALSGHVAALSTTDWEAISSQWNAIAAGTANSFTMPPEATNGTSVIMVDGRAVVNTGTGNDNVKVTIDPATGQVVVEVNGTKHYYPAGTPVTIRGGEGNDTIDIPKGTNVNVTLLGGAGDDRIQGGDGNETILGGHGKDDIKAGSGDDYVSGGSNIDYIDGQDGNDTLAGGLGNDTVYGLGGNDYLSGGSGRDYLEGAKGDDTIDGGADADVISGGRDNDVLRGGTGDDVFYGGHGQDNIVGGGGRDTAYRQDEDSVSGVGTDVKVQISDAATFIKIEGSDEFRERILADLDMYRASPTGQQMLQNLDDKRDPNMWFGENTLTIRELSDENGYAKENPGWFNSDSTVDINPGFTFDSESGRPSIVLYHELGHVYDFWNGTFDSDVISGGPDDGIRKAERQATGLPIDHDDDPSTPAIVDPDHPIQYTENGLRREMEQPQRDTYKTYRSDGW